MADDDSNPVPGLTPPPQLTPQQEHDADWLSPRHRAARILVRSTAIAWLVLVFSQILGAYTGRGVLSDTATQLMLTVGSALVAATSAYLVRRVERPPDPALENNVGLWLALTLGGMLIIMAGGAVMYVIVSLFQGADPPTLGSNALNLLSVMFGGTLGALGAYLGLRPEGERRRKEPEEPEKE